MHVPSPQGVPGSTQMRLPVQQPPFEQELPSQHGCPGPPQLAHVPPPSGPGEQAVPPAVHVNASFEVEKQQGSPKPPQAVVPVATHEPAVHSPGSGVQDAPGGMQKPPTQHAPAWAQ